MTFFEHMVRLHRWSGLALALFIVLLSSTGSLLVFRPELDRWLNQDLFVSPLEGKQLPASELVRRATERHPDMRPNEIIFPDVTTSVWRILMEPRPGLSTAAPLEVFVEPVRGVVLGSRRIEGGAFDRRTFFYYVRIFHYNLLLSTVMYRVLGIVAFIWLLTSFIGLYVAWPRRMSWRRAFSIKFSGGVRRVLFDAHRSVGILSGIVLIPILLSGLWWNLDFVTRPIVHAALPTTGWLQSVLAHQHPSPDDYPPAVLRSLDKVVDTACAAYGRDACTRIVIGYARQQYQVWLGPRAALAGEWIAPDMNGGGRGIRIFTMPADAEISSIDVRRAKSGDVYAALQYPLHTGAYFGSVGRFLWLVGGLAPLLLVISSVYLWCKRRPVSAKRRA